MRAASAPKRAAPNNHNKKSRTNTGVFNTRGNPTTENRQGGTEVI